MGALRQHRGDVLQLGRQVGRLTADVGDELHTVEQVGERRRAQDHLEAAAGPRHVFVRGHLVQTIAKGLVLGAHHRERFPGDLQRRSDAVGFGTRLGDLRIDSRELPSQSRSARLFSLDLGDELLQLSSCLGELRRRVARCRQGRYESRHEREDQRKGPSRVARRRQANAIGGAHRGVSTYPNGPRKSCFATE